MMADYSKDEYCLLSTHGFAMLADVVRSDEYAAPAAALALIVGELRPHRVSSASTTSCGRSAPGLPIRWIEGAAHNCQRRQPAGGKCHH